MPAERDSLSGEVFRRINGGAHGGFFRRINTRARRRPKIPGADPEPGFCPSIKRGPRGGFSFSIKRESGGFYDSIKRGQAHDTSRQKKSPQPLQAWRSRRVFTAYKKGPELYARKGDGKEHAGVRLQSFRHGPSPVPSPPAFSVLLGERRSRRGRAIRKLKTP